MSYLGCLYLFAHNGVQQILCCVFRRIVYPMSRFSGLSIFDDCPFGIL